MNEKCKMHASRFLEKTLDVKITGTSYYRNKNKTLPAQFFRTSCI